MHPTITTALLFVSCLPCLKVTLAVSLHGVAEYVIVTDKNTTDM